MANILGLALKVTGDASGLAKSLTPVDRALDSLGKQAEKATAVFQPFADKTAAAGRAQEEFAAKFETLAQQLRDGVVAPEQYAAAFGKLTEEAKASAAAFEEGLRVTREVRSEEERRAEELGRLQDLLERGAISQETFVRASERATGVEKERADAAASAARIIAANLTPQEKYDQQIQELTQHLDAGRLTQEQFNRAAQKAKSDLDGVGSEAAKTDKNIERLNNNVSILAKIEIGRLLFDGVRALGNAFTSVTSQISGLVGSVNSSVDTLNDFSARTGIGVEALQGYAVSAKLAGVDTEAFGASIQKLSVNIGKATPGDALDKSLRNINLSVQELRALSPEQQFSAIGQAISQLPTAADRAAAAVEVFGKQGAALAPLFREGADSIEELRARADRLGVIVNETQVENVASMNDGFDLVLATVQGIIGQVEGNLAPVVTAVTDEFLRFVENFASTEGTGGTGIANAITDVLLQGADYLAGVFDSFVASFTEWLSPLTTASTTFDAVTESLTAVTEILRGLFNGFQLVVNGLIIGMGKILEGLGAWVSTDLEAFGKGLADFGKQAAADNIKNINEAAGNAAQAVTNAFSGGNASPEAAGAGAAEDFVKGLKERIQRERAPEFQIATNIEKTRERFDVFFGGVVDQGSAVTDSMRGFEAAVAAVEDPLRMTEEEIARIKVAQDKVNEAINKELATRQEAADAAAKQADADAKRIEGLTKTNDAQSKLAEDIAAVEREQARVQEQQAAARNANDKTAADAAAARLAQLDQLQAKLQDTQAASEQGFSDGFTKAFDATGKSVSDLIAKTQDFGRVGAIAAEGLRNGVAAAQSQVRDGILTKESYDREVERQQDIFNQRLQGAQRVEQYLQSQLDERQRTELQYATQLEARKTEAIQNVQAIEDRIKAEEAEVESAREKGDLRSAKAGTQRIRQLRQAAAIEKQISSARSPQQNGQFGGGGGLRNAAGFGRNITNAEAEQQQQVARSQRQALQSVNNALASVALANAEMARRAELSRPVQGTVQTADIRTAEGAALVLGLGATAQDPRLIEARLQTKQLGLIRQAIIGATAGYRNTPAEIF
jgi:hypothetical protein